ncbi:MAG: GNAT family N-acetyltransferase [Sphingomonadaceae bacterium]
MFARTQRLLLRPGWIEDAPDLAKAVAHEDVAFKLARLPWPYTIADAQWFLGLDRSAADVNFLIFLRTQAEPELIGGIGIHDDEDGQSEIGYWIAPAHWGHGYATEAGQAVIDIARNGLRLPRLVSGHFVDNPASGAVLRKLGFRPTGKIVNRLSLARGHEVPCLLYEQEWGGEDGDTGCAMAA